MPGSRLTSACSTLLAVSFLLGACSSNDEPASEPAPPTTDISATTTAAPVTTAATTTAATAPVETTTTIRPTPEGEPCRQEGLHKYDLGNTYICVDEQFEPYMDDNLEFIGDHPTLIAKYDQFLADREARRTTTTIDDRPTEDEARLALAPTAQAWIAAPSADTYALLASEADRQNAGRDPIPLADATDNFWYRMQLLIEYPGNDSLVHRQLDLMDIDGALATFASGTYRVGDGANQIQPGVYVADTGDTPFDGCYWATLDDAGDIIDNNFIGSGFRAVANVGTNAFSVEFDRCGVFVQQP